MISGYLLTDTEQKQKQTVFIHSVGGSDGAFQAIDLYNFIHCPEMTKRYEPYLSCLLQSVYDFLIVPDQSIMSKTTEGPALHY